MVGLPDGENNFEDMCNRLGTIPACDRQTDRRTDRQTSCHGIVRAMHTRRAVKNQLKVYALMYIVVVVYRDSLHMRKQLINR